MGVELQEGFPDSDGAVCSTFFSSVDLSDKLWASIERLAHADDVTFWTVLANHEKLAVVLLNVVTAIDHAHSSHSKAERRAVTADGERHVIELVVRIATTTEPCARRGVDPASLATRLGVLLPWKVLLPASLMLLRHSGAAASVTVSALFLLNPGYLCTLNSYMPIWWDSVNRFAVRCSHELQRGRYQRLPGDILAAFEQVYRLTKQLWAVLQCAPFLSDYLSLARTLRSLRIIVDVISPILQHFIIVCDELSTRRAILSRANSVIVNAAINTTSVLLLYHTFSTQGPQKHHHEGSCAPQVTNATYSRLREHLQQYAQGYPQYILRVTQNQTFDGLIRHLCPPTLGGDAAGNSALGQLLLSLAQEMTDSNDFAEAARGTRSRFFELVLLDVVRQGVHIDGLLVRHFVTPEEASKLGASEDAVTRALAGLPSADAVATPTPARTPAPEPGTTAAAAAAATPAPAAEVVDDPLVAMVMDVFPQYSPAGIRAALNFYANDVEQFIMDASMENLPPHLVGPLSATGPSDAELAATLAAEDERPGIVSPETAATETHGGMSAAAAHLQSNDYDDAFQPETLYRLLGRDLYELVTDSDADDGSTDAMGGGEEDHDSADDVDYKITMNDPRTYMSDAFDVDEEMKAKIRMLNEVMYEDELDDGQQDVNVAGGDIIDDASDDESAGGGEGRRRGERSRRGGASTKPGSPNPPVHTDPASASPSPAPGAAGTAGATPAAPPRAPHDEYHDKRYHEKRAKDRVARTKQIQAERGERVPAYASKKKTSKAKASGTKTSLQRAVKKGKYDPDA